jgi:hypothetical protein
MGKTQTKYAYDDKRRPVPDLELRYRTIALVNGKLSPKNGDLFTVDEFVEMAKSGGVTNWDGTGYYAYADDKRVLESNQRAKPDEMRVGFADFYWTHVMWYNK